MFDCFIFLDLMGPPSLRRQERTSHSHDTDSASRHERLYLHSLVTTDSLDANYPRHLSPGSYLHVRLWIRFHSYVDRNAHLVYKSLLVSNVIDKNDKMFRG